jgi:hypothetical protein
MINPGKFARNQVLMLLACAFIVQGAALKNPRWKIEVLIYQNIDFQFTDDLGVLHHITTSMTEQEKTVALTAAKKFLEVDVPALTSGNMIPLGTIKFISRPLTKLVRYGSCEYAFWPDPAGTAQDRDPVNFDSAIVIFQERGFDWSTGRSIYVGCFGGLTWPMGTGQTYTSFIFRIFSPEQRNVFKHEWGHSILFYYDAAGTAPKPAVDNHAVANYRRCGAGTPYILVDDSETAPIPNSIYHNLSGFTHDYYSGTTALASQPDRCLGITPAAWASGGPVTRPIKNPGDLNRDGSVDTLDLQLLTPRLNQTAAGPSDPMDLDYDGNITVLDARILVTFCGKPSCAR